MPSEKLVFRRHFLFSTSGQFFVSLEKLPLMNALITVAEATKGKRVVEFAYLTFYSTKLLRPNHHLFLRFAVFLSDFLRAVTEGYGN